MGGDGTSGSSKKIKKPLPMIKYKPRPGGPAFHWSSANRVKKCGCFSDYAYSNEVVLALASERKSLSNQVQRGNTDIEELRKTVKVQHDRIIELEKIARHYSAMVGFVRTRTEGIFADCEMIMEEVVGVQLDGQIAGSSSVGQPSESPNPKSPEPDGSDPETDPSEDPNPKD